MTNSNTRSSTMTKRMTRLEQAQAMAAEHFLTVKVGEHFGGPALIIENAGNTVHAVVMTTKLQVTLWALTEHDGWMNTYVTTDVFMPPFTGPNMADQRFDRLITSAIAAVLDPVPSFNDALKRASDKVRGCERSLALARQTEGKLARAVNALRADALQDEYDAAQAEAKQEAKARRATPGCL